MQGFLVGFLVEDQADGGAPLVQGLLLSEAVLPGHAGGRGLAAVQVGGDGVHLDGVERPVGGDDHGLVILAFAVEEDQVLSFARKPGAGHVDIPFAAPDAHAAVHSAAGAAGQVGQHVVGKAEGGRGPLVDAALGADVGAAVEVDGFGHFPAGGRAGEQPGDGHGVAAHVHDAAAGGAVLLADVVQIEPHVEGEVRLDQPHLADGAVADQFHQFGGLRVAAVHKGFQHEDVVVAGRLDQGHGLAQMAGQRFFAEHVLAGLGALDGPLGVQVVGQGVVHHVHIRVGEQRVVAGVAPGYGELVAESVGGLLLAAAHSHQFAGARLGNGLGELASYAASADNAPAEFAVGHGRFSPRQVVFDDIQ